MKELGTTAILMALITAVVSGPASASGEDRLFLIGDGSFEGGACGENISWTCGTDTSCPNWIIDPMDEWGILAYDGEHVAQLGGLCGEELNSNSICQEIEIDWVCVNFWLTWRWMGFVDGDAPGSFDFTINGAPYYSQLEPSGPIKDTGGVWQEGFVGVLLWGGVYDICFEFEEGADPSAMLIDFVSNPISPTPVESESFSTVKRLY